MDIKTSTPTTHDIKTATRIITVVEDVSLLYSTGYVDLFRCESRYTYIKGILKTILDRQLF